MRQTPAGLVLVASLLASGCAIHRAHTADPYAHDPSAARGIEDDAAKYCLEHEPGPQPPYAFTTDGCSLWPDGNWGDCCVRHDIAYWCGGTFDDRVAADRALQGCVRDTAKSDALACAMRAGVFVGGAQIWPTSFRWGYGWPYPHAGPTD